MSLLLKIHEIHNCLNIICDVESDIFDSSFKGLFKKKDYLGYEGILEVAATKLIDIYQSLENFDSGKPGINMVVMDAKNYAYALFLSTSQLIIINKSLGLKSLGNPYSMGKYNDDCKLFRELQSNYMSIGTKLNADYKLYGYEIATMEE
jgi:hypothetical protein